MTAPRSHRRQVLLGLAPTFVLLAWLFQGLLAGEVLFKRDSVLVFLPLKRWLAQSFSAGAFPEWWPFDALGQPMSSLPIASLFHPTTLLYGVFPETAALSLQTWLPLLVLPWGMWRLARSVGLRGPSAALATVVVGVSFWNVLLTEQTQMHLAAASLPWLWAEGLRLARGRGSLVVFVLATANLLLGGDPMLFELAVVCLAVLVLRRPLRPVRLAQVAGAGALGLGLAAVQWVPMLLAWVDSPRSVGQGLTVDDLWALRFPQLAGAVLPVHHGTDFLFDTLYVGAPVVVLAGLGLAGSWRARWRWGAVLLLLVVTAFGRAGGLWHVWSAVLPGWKGFQYPVKALGPAMIPLGLLAGHGLLRLRARWPWALSAVSGVALLALGVWSAVLQLVAALAGAMAPKRVAFLWVAIGALALDVAWQLGPLPTRPPQVVTEPPPLARVLREAGVGADTGVYEWTYTVPETMDSRLPSWRDVQTEFQVLTVAPDTGALFGLPTSRTYLAGVTRSFFELHQSPTWPQLAPRFGVVARVETFQGSTPPTPNLAADLELGAAVVRLERALPRAYLASRARALPASEHLAALVSTPEDTVLLDDARGLDEASPLQPVPMSRGVDTLSFQVSAARESVLVINESWSRGWSARVDGAPAPVLKANHAVMAVRLSPGAHRVELEYSTPWLGVGAGVSVLSALLLVALRVRARFTAS